MLKLQRRPHIVLSTSTQRLWRDSPASGSWDSPSQRRSPGLISAVMAKTQQWLYFLNRLRRANLRLKLLVNFYRYTTESILTNCMTALYISCTKATKKALQRVVKTEQEIVGIGLPSFEHLHTTRCVRKVKNIIKVITHPGHYLFELLPSGRHFRSIHTHKQTEKHWAWTSPQFDSMLFAAVTEACALFTLPIVCNILHQSHVIQHPKTPSFHICPPHLYLYCTYYYWCFLHPEFFVFFYSLYSFVWVFKYSAPAIEVYATAISLCLNNGNKVLESWIKEEVAAICHQNLMAENW